MTCRRSIAVLGFRSCGVIRGERDPYVQEGPQNLQTSNVRHEGRKQMASLIDLISSRITPEIVDKLARFADTSSTAVYGTDLGRRGAVC